MPKYTVKIIVTNIDNEPGDDSDDLILTDTIVAEDRDDAAHLIGVSLDRRIRV